MLIYIFKRILVFIPTFFIICIIAFIINSAAPGDPVRRLMSGNADKAENIDFYNQRYAQLQHQLGLDLPLFYITVNTMAEPDTLYKISNQQHKRSLVFLLNNFGNWNTISAYYSSLNSLLTSTTNLYELNKLLVLLSQSSDLKQFDYLINSLMLEVKNTIYNDEIKKSAGNLFQNWLNVKSNDKSWKSMVPVIRLHANNQFHRWLFGDGNAFTGANATYTEGIIRGDFGKSYITGKSVGRQLLEKTKWTVFFSLTSILLAYFISIPIGVKAGSKPGFAFDKWSSNILAVLYAMPPFFVAALLLTLFANPAMLNWLPASGVAPILGYDENISFMRKVMLSLPYVILPLICYTYGSLTFLSRTIRSGMREEMQKEYILSARAKGLAEEKVVWRHAFSNALFPLITLIGYIIPTLIGGSVILEGIFSIPGLGLEIVMSIFNQDYPVIVAVFAITGVLTIIGYLIADLLYAWADPRIKLN